MENEKRLIDANALSGIAFQIKQYGKGVRCVVDLNDVDDIPTVDAVEVVHGRWIKGKYPGEYTCSRCSMEYCEAEPTVKPFKYCPECGSKNE